MERDEVSGMYCMYIKVFVEPAIRHPLIALTTLKGIMYVGLPSRRCIGKLKIGETTTRLSQTHRYPTVRSNKVEGAAVVLLINLRHIDRTPSSSTMPRAKIMKHWREPDCCQGIPQAVSSNKCRVPEIKKNSEIFA
jgi:hypothetical protein